MRKALLFLVSLSLLAGIAPAQEATQATAVICTGVENRTPQGVADSFPASVGELYCFSEVRHGQGSIVHVWFHADKEVARVSLTAKGPRYRTWSKKRIPPSWTGSWRVEVRTPEGQLLQEKSFTVTRE